MLRRYRGTIPAFALAYAGFALVLVPMLLPVYYPLEMLVSQLGSALIVAALVWFINSTFYARLEARILDQKALTAKGVKELGVVSPSDIGQLLDHFSSSSMISILLNWTEVNRSILELINSLQERQLQRPLRLLVAGAKAKRVRDLVQDSGASFEEKMLAEMLHMLVLKARDGANVEVGLSPTTVSHTVVLGQRSLFLLAPYAPEGEDMLSLSIASASELARQHYRQFEDLWEGCSDLDSGSESP